MVLKRRIKEIKILEILDKKGFLSKKGKAEFKKNARIVGKGLVKRAKTSSGKADIKARFKKFFKTNL